MKKIKTKQSNIKKLNVVFLLDRSGSMRTSVKDTIEGYNSYLEKQRKNNTLVTTVLFDDYSEILYYRKNIKDVSELTEEEYYVRGCTALYDAIGSTINMLGKDAKDEKVLFVITTDGLENVSKEFDKRKISDLISKHKDWEFIYLGANIDSYAEGNAIGIKKENISNYKKNKKGIDSMFKSISYLSKCIACDEKISEDWKKDIEE